MIFKTLLVGATLIYGRACDPLIGKLQSPVTETPSRLQVDSHARTEARFVMLKVKVGED